MANELIHHCALHQCRLSEHSVKGSHDRYFEARQQLQDIVAGVAAKNSVFVLKGNDVHVRAVYVVLG